MTESNNKTMPVAGFNVNPHNINMNGRPKKEFSITNALKEIMTEINPETKIERYKELLNKALNMAMEGDGDMLKYLINRIEGLPKASTEHSGEIKVLPILGGKSQEVEIIE